LAITRFFKAGFIKLRVSRKEVKTKNKAKTTAIPRPAKNRWHWLIEPPSLPVHPPGELFKDTLVLIILALATHLTNIFLDSFNIAFLFIRIGSLLLLILTIATVIYVLKMIAHLLHGLMRLRKQYKFLVLAIVVAGAILATAHKEAVVSWLLTLLWQIPWQDLNPVSFWHPYYWR
jgi:hypothetical protein